MYLGIIITIIVSYLVMVHSAKVFKVLGDAGRKAVTWLMGLIVLAIAIHFFINGIGDVLPHFMEMIWDSTGELA